MSTARVFVTGIGLTSPIGHDLATVTAALKNGRHGIVTMPEWDQVAGLGTRLAAVADAPISHYTRKQVRTMGRVAILSTYATEQAVKDAGLPPEIIQSDATGLAYGSTHGSSASTEEFCRKVFERRGFQGIAASTYLKFMSNTTTVNLAQYFGIRGRVLSTCSACTSGSHAIGQGYETIKHGYHEVMLCGGAEEMHFSHAGIFDILYATSTQYNTRPDASPRPFDVARDGLVVGEGAGTLVLESEAHARRRGARIYGEVIGFGASCDGEHVTMPSVDGMASAMRKSLADAGVSPGEIDYINAHGTGTEAGDIAESHATLKVLGPDVPISSTKGHTGHTLGACGALESAFCLSLMRENFVPPTRNLETVDTRCAPLNFVRGEAQAKARMDVVMNNNFAFGGINTSLIFRKMS
ncbi:MAG TPA: beta-ketoacyl-ACP synthase [Polyangia bacterium]